MTKEEIKLIQEEASQPLQNSWRFWVALLSSKGVSDDALLEYKPSIRVVCEPMLGYTRMVDGTERAVYISRECATDLFQEALDIVRAFGQISDLLTLASYRCQIDMDDIVNVPEVDEELYELTKRHFQRMTSKQLERMEVRMPEGSQIRVAIMLLRHRKDRCALPRAA